MPFERSYFTKTNLYYQIRRIFQKRIWRILKQSYFDVSTTKYDYGTYYFGIDSAHKYNKIRKIVVLMTLKCLKIRHRIRTYEYA